MDVEKVFVKSDNTARIKCPYCKVSKIASFEKFRKRNKNIKIKCSCEKLFQLNIEFRKMFRKETELHGLYVNYSQKNDQNKILVKNVSMSGIGFITQGEHRIEKDHKLKVEFTLDNENKPIITREVLVRHVRKNFIGCEFIKMAGYDKVLGFYLMP